jgi:hypothetical protein
LDRLKITFGLLLLFVLQPVFAQQNEVNASSKLISERVYITTNSTTFLTGEKLYYAITCLNTAKSSFSEFSKIAYVELINNEKQVVFKNKLFLKNSKGNGDYFIPSSLKTGKYKLIAYTNWMVNSSLTDISAIDIAIINPYQSLDDKNVVIQNTKANDNPIASNLKEAYTFEKKKYGKREKIALRLNESAGIDKQGSYTLKVVKKDSLFSQMNTKSSTSNSLTKKANISAIPEFRGEIIKGKIKAKKDPEAPLKNINISLSIAGNSSFIKIVKTNNEGHFAFTIETPYQTDKFQLQILDKEIDEYTIEFENNDLLDYSNLTFDPITISPSIKKTLESRSVASQIENAYLDLKKDSITTDNTINNDYLKFDLVFNLDDYTRFQTLKETLTEIISGAYYKTVGKKNEIHIVDKAIEYELSYPALVLIDGFYIQDVNELFKYNVDNVKSIHVIKGGYYYGTKIFNGVIFIKTKNTNYENTNKNIYLLEPELLRPLQEKKRFNIDYSKNDYSRIPDYRYQLLWNPELKPEETEINFYTSDITGTFEVILEGIDSTGKPVLLSDSFEVE